MSVTQHSRSGCSTRISCSWHRTRSVEQGGGLSRYLFEKGVAHPEESNEIARAIFKKFIGSGEIPEEYMDMSLYEAMRKIQDNFQERGTAEQFRLEIPVMIAQAVLAWAKSPLDIGRSLKKVIDTKALEKHLSKEKVKNIKIANTQMPRVRMRNSKRRIRNSKRVNR